MNITSTNTMIFAKEYNGKTYYRAGLSSKKQDGSYESAYIDVKLPKGVALNDKSKIDITKGFLSFYKNKENKDVFYIVIQELRSEYENYNTNKTKEEKKEEDVYANFGTSIKAEDLDDGLELPF